MTTIVYKDGVLCGDKRVTNGTFIEPETTKIFKRESDGALIGAAGTIGLANRFIKWFLAGEMGDGPSLFEGDREAEALIIRPDGKIENYYRSGIIYVEGGFYAIGSGSASALTALDLGCSAVEAVEAAARRDSGTGSKCDVLCLDLAISALTPPLQHKGGETEAGGEAKALIIDMTGIDFSIPELIIRERVRQVSEEGWTQAHDDQHTGGQMHAAAVCYVQHGTERAQLRDDGVPYAWPWDARWWKPKDRVRNLVRAGALILAERARCIREDINLPSTYLLRNICEELSLIDAASSEADSGPRSEAPAGDARIEQTISTLQASSGEGETIPAYQLILDERQRQIEVEGWSETHDDEHDNGEMQRAAKCYLDVDGSAPWEIPAAWPWDISWWKPKDIRRNLVRAGALALAEKERLQRKYGDDVSIFGCEAIIGEAVKRLALELQEDREATETPPEPAAYSPVNNADEPFIDDTVAGSFARGKDREIELAAEADAVEQVKPKRFGIFGK